MDDVGDNDELAPGYGARLRRAREEHPTRAAINRADLARKLGYKRETNLSAQVSAWEREGEEIPYRKREPLARVLQVSYSWLILNQGDMLSSDENVRKTTGGSAMADLDDLQADMRGVKAQLAVLEDKVDRLLTLMEPKTNADPRTGRTT